MIQVRIHGRGGQGVVTSAELIAIAAFKAGQESQAFPFFGVERTGAPIEAYARIDTKPIRVREQIYNPDIIIVQDDSLIGSIDVLKGSGPATRIIVNSAKSREELSEILKIDSSRTFVFGGTQLALKILGKNITNTAILGAFARLTGIITMNHLKLAIKEKFGEKGEDLVTKNTEAAEEAFKILDSELTQ